MLELFLYNIIKRTPRIKNVVRTCYQVAFLPWIGPRYTGTATLITRSGYFFGFHDKTPWCPRNRYLLAHRITGSFDPAKSSVEVGYFVNSQLTEFIPIDTTEAWSKQQGAQLQWCGEDIIYNTRRGDGKAVGVIASIRSGEKRLLDFPIGAVDSRGRYACAVEFGSFGHGMPGYGYGSWAFDSYLSHRNDKRATGVTEIDLRSGEAVTHLELAELMELVGWQPTTTWHSFISHIQYSPDGTKISFMVRRAQPGRRIESFICIYNKINRRATVTNSGPMASHYCWLDNDSILAFLETLECRDEFVIISASNGQTESVQGLPRWDGHPNFSIQSQHLVLDSYPDRRRRQALRVYKRTDRTTFEQLEIMRFYSPLRYRNEDRVDLHTRWDRLGQSLCVDSSFSGVRSMTVIAPAPHE